MGFVDKSLAAYARFFDTPIPQLPHPSLFRWLNALVFQPPERIRVLVAAKLPEPDYLDRDEDPRPWREQVRKVSPAWDRRSSDPTSPTATPWARG
jgi:hypothetical protein